MRSSGCPMVKALKRSAVCIPTFCQHHHPDCWKCLVHLSFSPNHAIYNFNFCGSFRKHVEGKHFCLDDDVFCVPVTRTLGPWESHIRGNTGKNITFRLVIRRNRQSAQYCSMFWAIRGSLFYMTITSYTSCWWFFLHKHSPLSWPPTSAAEQWWGMTNDSC